MRRVAIVVFLTPFQDTRPAIHVVGKGTGTTYSILFCEPRPQIGGWPGLSITRTHPTKWVPHSSRSVRRVGAMPHAAPISTLPKSGTSNSIIPALANNARTGHPPLDRVGSSKAGPPACGRAD